MEESSVARTEAMGSSFRISSPKTKQLTDSRCLKSTINYFHPPIPDASYEYIPGISPKIK